MKSWTYKIPFAPVSLNDAYGIQRGRGGWAFKYLKNQLKDQKEYIRELLKEQDSKRGKPEFATYSCSYLFLYPEHQLFIESVPKQYRRLHDDPVYQNKDISNYFKLMEDAIFEYLGISDSRVVSLYGYKRACKELPFPVERYNVEYDKYDMGVVLVKVRSEPHGVFMTSSDPAYQEFGKELEDTEFVNANSQETPRPMPTTPEWYTPGKTKLKDVDLTKELLKYNGIRKMSPVYKSRDRLYAKTRRIVWGSDVLKIKEAKFAEIYFSAPKALKELHKACVKEGLEPGSKDFAKAFYGSKEWFAYLLNRETQEVTVERFFAISDFFVKYLKPKSKIHLIGSGIGSFAYPFSYHECDIVAVDYKGKSSEAFVRRIKENDLFVEFETVGSYKDITPLPKADVLVMIDVIDRIRNPVEFLTRHVKSLKKGSFLLISYGFKQTKGRKSKPEYPWILVDKIKGLERRKAVQKFLKSKGTKLKFIGQSMRDDIKIFQKQ